MKWLIAIVVFAVMGAAPTMAQGTQVPIPPHGTLYNIFARGFWFQAPTDFTIVGLRVPVEVTTPGALHLVRTPIAPDQGSGSQITNFTTLHYSNNHTPGTLVPVNVQVTNGDYIGILASGYIDASNDETSYCQWAIRLDY